MGDRSEAFKEIDEHNALSFGAWARKYNITDDSVFEARLIPSQEGYMISLTTSDGRWAGSSPTMQEPPKLHTWGVGTLSPIQEKV